MTDTSEKMAETLTNASGRFAAGEDPVKRKQILDGARRVFLRVGFDAASMNDVTREAGVSKGTLYVYFDNKEELFSAMIEDERAAFLARLRTILTDEADMEQALHDFGTTFIAHVTSDKVIDAMRSVLGVRQRMPELCQRFFKGPENLRTVLCDYLGRAVEAGTLVIPDIELAAGQFLDMCSGSFFKQRLFGSMEGPPTAEQTARVVDGALNLFLCAYRAPRRG